MEHTDTDTPQLKAHRSENPMDWMKVVKEGSEGGKEGVDGGGGAGLERKARKEGRKRGGWRKWCSKKGFEKGGGEGDEEEKSKT